MGDLGTAKRSLMWMKEAVTSSRWDNYESQLQKAEQALEGIPDTEKAEVVAELNAVRQQADKAIKAEKSGALLRDVDRRLNSIEPRNLGIDDLDSRLKTVLGRLESDEGKAVLEPEVMATYRAKIAAKRAEHPSASAPPPAPPAPAPVAAPVAQEHQVALGTAKRSVTWMKDAVGSARWDNYESHLQKAEQALQGIPDAAKAEVVAELNAVRQQADKAIKAEKSGALLRDVDRRLSSIEPRNLGMEDLESRLKTVLGRLESDEGKAVLEPEVMAAYRAKLDAKRAEHPSASATAPSRAAPPAGAPVTAASAQPQQVAPPAPAAQQASPARAAPNPAPAAAAVSAPAADLGPAKRNLTWLRETISSRRWDQVDDRVSKVEQALATLGDADKAPLVAELTSLKQEAERGAKQEKAARLMDEMDRKIRGADPQHNAPDRVASMLRDASVRLDSEEMQRFLEPDVIAGLRAKIASVGNASAAGEKSRRVDKIQSLIAEFEEAFGTGPFVGADDHTARSTHQRLSSLLTGARNNLQDIPPGDSDGQALDAKLKSMSDRVDSGWAEWEQAGAARNLTEAWQRAQERFAGWKDESDAELGQTRQAIRHCTDWQKDAAPVQAKYPADGTIRKLVDEANSVLQAATAKLQAAFNRLISEVEAAPLPTDKRQLEKTQSVVYKAREWLDRTEHLEAAVARANALHARWTQNVERLDREGAELYARLEQEAAAKWPGILAGLKAESGFDPSQLEAWKGKTVLIRGWNRAGWDFAGDHHYEVRLGETPVAGNWDDRVNAALRDAVTRTRMSVNDHTDWDVVGVVQGPGKVKRRTQHEVLIKNTNEKVKAETWDPEPCVVIQVIALRAGPVAIGPG